MLGQSPPPNPPHPYTHVQYVDHTHFHLASNKGRRSGGGGGGREGAMRWIIKEHGTSDFNWGTVTELSLRDFFEFSEYNHQANVFFYQ